ncbi:MAG: asparaginase [Clostridiales bacterium]|nr:asparaginase [Clostridiales bacterium]
MIINLVATGGTIGSRLVKGELVISDAATEQIAAVIGANKIYGDFKIHSAGVEFADLNTLRLTIEKAADGADGVVVTHGTDTLAFTASYLAYAFSSTKIPIVLCAADKPLTDVDSNGFDVLNAAKGFIARGERGVYVLYKNPGEVVRIHHGARLIPAHMHENFYFSLGGSTFTPDSGLMRGMNFELETGKVLCIIPYMGMDYSAYDVKNYAAVVQVAYHSGRINTVAFNKFAANNPNVPIFLLSADKKYAANTFPKNVVQCPSITQTALYIKLLIGVKNNVKDLAAFVKKNVCGEIVE